MKTTPKDSTTRRPWITLIVLVLLLVGVGALIALLGGGDVAQSPSYQVKQTIEAVEIREYDPYVVAETDVDGTIEGAGNQGFRILAKYIFGGNQGNTKVAMTAPVSQERAAPSGEGEKIEMTAPVTQKRSGDQFTIQFMMPSKYTVDTLPTPNDSRIRFREVEGRTLAAIQYSGRWTERNYEEHLRELVGTLRRNGYEPVGEPVWARYDPPFKPWFMRRNEILTEFRRDGDES